MIALVYIGELLEKVEIVKNIVATYMIRNGIDSLTAGDVEVKTNSGVTKYDHEGAVRALINKLVEEGDAANVDLIEQVIEEFTEIPDPKTSWAKVTKELKLTADIEEEPVPSLRFIFSGKEFAKVEKPRPKDRDLVVERKEDREDGIPF